MRKAMMGMTLTATMMSVVLVRVMMVII
jgi:hypothetical protein